MTHLNRIHRREVHQSGRARVVVHSVHVVDRVRHRLHFFDQRPGIRIAPALQVRIKQEVHGVELVALSAHVHGRRPARSCHRGQIRIDVLLPHANPGEDVRGHMQRVRRRRSHLRITPRRGQPQLRQLRLVISVNQIVRHSRMIRLSRK